jgi:hypothetical protein
MSKFPAGWRSRFHVNVRRSRWGLRGTCSAHEFNVASTSPRGSWDAHGACPPCFGECDTDEDAQRRCGCQSLDPSVLTLPTAHLKRIVTEQVRRGCDDAESLRWWIASSGWATPSLCSAPRRTWPPRAASNATVSRHTHADSSCLLSSCLTTKSRQRSSIRCCGSCCCDDRPGWRGKPRRAQILPPVRRLLTKSSNLSVFGSVHCRGFAQLRRR